MNKTYVCFNLDIVNTGNLKVFVKASKLVSVRIGILSDKALISHRSLPIIIYEQIKLIALGLRALKRVVQENESSYDPNKLKYKPDFFVRVEDHKNDIPKKYLNIYEQKKGIINSLIKDRDIKEIIQKNNLKDKSFMKTI